MKEQRYRWILYLIVAVIIATIGIQIYWNYKNYLANKQQLINDVQLSLDKAVDDYYANLAEQTTVGFAYSGSYRDSIFGEDSEFSSIIEQIDENNKTFSNLDSLKTNHIKGITILRGRAADSMMNVQTTDYSSISPDSLKQKIKHWKGTKEGLSFENIEMLTSKVMISIKNDTLDLSTLDSMVNIELQRKNISVPYDLDYERKNNPIQFKDKKSIKKHTDSLKPENSHTLKTFSNSTFLPKNSQLSIAFANVTKTVLKRILGGILISTLLVLAVIGCLFYLLHIIKHQKELAEIKNDLISNITHEFKTPISTISVALESIRNFNGIDDKEKTKKYISMSSQQLDKLNIMVEKLLETATLDSENLDLKKEKTNVAELLKTLVNRYKIQFTDKQFETLFRVEPLFAEVDIFHFENALNNILDNAVKYGGKKIIISLVKTEKQFEIHISDNGNTLTKANKDKIFEKFYRIPKGNTHDIKGFGIGLYYTKTIIDKHGGTISLDLTKNRTTFKITLPYGQ